jgi:hypothetical protein
MRFPNLRYGNPTEFAHYAMGRTLSELAGTLRRDERTIRNWLSGSGLQDKPRVHQLGVVTPVGELYLVERRRPLSGSPTAASSGEPAAAQA